jgi:hypothetical protein
MPCAVGDSGFSAPGLLGKLIGTPFIPVNHLDFSSSLYRVSNLRNVFIKLSPFLLIGQITGLNAGFLSHLSLHELILF